MIGKTRRRPRRVLPLLVALAAVGLLVGVVVIAWLIIVGRPPVPGPGPTPPEKPKAQSAACPDVQLLAIPGTWESSSADDPRNPVFNPNSLMLNVTRPIVEQFPGTRVDVYTVPYVAQFSNPIALPPDGQQSYDVSRAEGTQRATAVLADRYAECPLTTYVLAGFSQGAVIVGDIAAQIGAGNGPVPEDLVLGVTVIADGRRAPDQAIAVGPDPGGVGAEVALGGLRVPGITMTGAREGGFGDLADRTNSICAPTDLICDAPRDAMKPINLVGSGLTLVSSIGSPVHNLYNTFAVEPDVTATQWTATWAAGLIEGAPHPEHLPN